ncbi:HEPN domain-containing protein [Nocardioides sp. MH1]|uniref:ApeA N-terminal domain 1-containing protein n=1 Tax=Nocardioides sp. MH1 TaxID=3242490 RepID=UPI00351F93B9
MDELTEFGWFWLPSNESRRFPGTLRFSTDGGGELTLHANPDVHDNLVDASSPSRRVVGMLEDDYVTLDRCFPVHTQFFGGTQRLSVGVVVKGACFDDDGDLEFNSISFEVDGAPEWIGRTAVERDWRHEPADAMHYSLTLNPIPPETVGAPFGSVSLRYGWRTDGGDDASQDSIHQMRRFELQFDHLQPLDQLLRRASAVQDLVTIAANRQRRMHSLVVTHPGATRDDSSDAPLKRLDLLINNREGADPSVRTRSTDLLFTYEQLGGLAAVARWVVVRDELRHPVDALMTVRYGRVGYLESRFQNVVGAAEALHRVRFPNELRPREEYRAFKRMLVKHVPSEHQEWLHSQLQYSNEPRLLQRLRDLVAFGGDEAVALVGDAKAWSEEVRDVRNGFVHEPARNTPVSSERVHYLSESLYFVLVLALLRECGYDHQVSQSIATHRQVDWVKERLRATQATTTGHNEEPPDSLPD